MVGILQVLVIHLPVAGQLIAVVAVDLELLAGEDGVEIGQDSGRQVFLQGLDLVAVGREDHAVAGGDAQLAQAVFLVLEVLGHAALAVHTALERDALQIAFQVVGPLVVGADEFLGVALAVAAELRATVGAAVLEDIDRAVLGARDHHRGRSDIGPLVVARVGQLGFQGHVVPGLAVEYLLDFLVIDGAAGVDPVRDVMQRVLRPDTVGQRGVLGCHREADDGL